MKITIELNTESMSTMDQKVIKILAGAIEDPNINLSDLSDNDKPRPMPIPNCVPIPNGQKPRPIPNFKIKPKGPFPNPFSPFIIATEGEEKELTEGNPNLDKTGALWDKEIHVTPPTLNVKGEWRIKKRMENLKIVTKQEENQRLFPKPPPAPLVPGPIPEVPPPFMVKSAPKKQATPTPVAPPSPPAIEEEQEPSPFSQLIAQLIPLLKSDQNKEGVITVEQLESCAASLGLIDADGKGDISLLQYNEDLIPTFGEKVNELISS